MPSTINAEEFQSTLNQFESWFGLSFADFSELSTAEQEDLLYRYAANLDSSEVYTWADETYAYVMSLMSVYDDMIDNGNALERAQAALYKEDLTPLADTIAEFSSLWGEQTSKIENDNQESNGGDISYTLSEAYDGQEVTLNLSESETDTENWISDPNADDPYMYDSDGDGYKDKTFYVSSRSEYDVVNIDGKTVNVDTDNDGDIDQYDGVAFGSSSAEDYPTCEIDLNGGSWELVDYNPDTHYYRLKVTSGEEPNLIESYINVYGPCYIVPTNGTQPSEAVLQSYNEQAMRFFKQSKTAEKTVGEILYGEAATTSENMTILMDSNALNNVASLSPTEEQFAAGATITIDLESETRDDINIDCQNADAHFSWVDGDLHMTLTNEAGETMTYVFKNFETAGMLGLDSDKADYLHLTNVDISDAEMLNLASLSSNYGDGSGFTDVQNESTSATYSAYSVASQILLEDSESESGESTAYAIWLAENAASNSASTNTDSEGSHGVGSASPDMGSNSSHRGGSRR